MSISPKFSSHAEAKKAGWFSRRHESSEEHQKAVEVRRQRQQEKIQKAQKQQEETEKRNSKEQKNA